MSFVYFLLENLCSVFRGSLYHGHGQQCGDCRGWARMEEGVWGNMAEGDLTWGGKHTTQCTDDVLRNCARESCIILLTSVTSINSGKGKKLFLEGMQPFVIHYIEKIVLSC